MSVDIKHLKSVLEYRDGCFYYKLRTSNCINVGDKAGYLLHTKSGDRNAVHYNGHAYLSARLIFFYHYGYFPLVVDHIDNNQLNDRIENLRAATRDQNNRNRTSQKNSSSNYLGVFRNNAFKSIRWTAALSHNHQKIYLGSFKTELEAAEAYNKAAEKLHGEFANLNKINL